MISLGLFSSQASAAIFYEEGCLQGAGCQEATAEQPQDNPAHQGEAKESEENWQPRRDSPYRLDGRAYPVQGEGDEMLVGVLL
jgi:hypothetical protein